MIDLLVFAGKAVLAYLMGSVSGSLLIGRLRGVDIRTLGSGNAGGTNAFRTQGLAFAAAVVAIDIGKGVLAALLSYLPPVGTLHPASQALALGLACTAGHVWPLFFDFRGGKGAAVMVGVICVVFPQALWVALPVWLLVLGWTGFVGLATVAAGLTLPLAVLLMAVPGYRFRLLVFMSLYAFVLLYTHRENLMRVLDGTENRFDRARVLARWFGRAPGPGA